MKKYEKIIQENDELQNKLAIYVLIDHGREHLLDEDYYKQLTDEIESGKTKNPYMTKEYEKQILDISVEIARLEHNDIFDLIQKEFYSSNKQLEKENDNNSPDYDY